MHYRRNYLSKVICRIDFGEIPALKGQDKPEFSGRLQDIFPVAIGRPTSTLSLTVGPGGSGVQQELISTIWEHRKQPDGTKVLHLGPQFLALEYGQNDYDYFPPFRAEMERAYREFQNLYHVMYIARLGLRFVNEITMPQGNAMDWANLIKPDLITAVRAGLRADMDLVRSFHQLQLKREGITLLMHYGLINPDFPNPVVRRHFVIDIDAARPDAIPAGEVIDQLVTLNECCETQFESSIEDGLRAMMEIINE